MTYGNRQRPGDLLKSRLAALNSKRQLQKIASARDLRKAAFGLASTLDLIKAARPMHGNPLQGTDDLHKLHSTPDLPAAVKLIKTQQPQFINHAHPLRMK